eukprot:XP_011433532.1 PREDICTED: uncharacterized protein LOC105332585 [Crassostrea gigas]
MNSKGCKMMKLFLLYIVVLNMVITTAAETTNNRILLSSVLVGTALAASVSGNYDFSYTDLALLTTAVLVVNFPTNPPVPVQDSCTAPGYTADPLLGCYRVVTSDTSFVTYDQAKQECVNDGGRLLLINSEAEANALVAILRTYAAGGLPYWFIQGTRTGASLTWFDDSGNPLIYLPSTVTSQNSLTSTRLSLTLQLGGFQYEALQPATTSNRFVCEI